MTTTVPITDVRPDPKQPRTYFREAALRQLATSIKKTGQRQPITVRRRKQGAKPPFEIIDGERRWRACQLAGLQTIRIDIEVRSFDKHAEQHLLSLTSNFMREGHTHVEISQAIQYQVDSAMADGLTRGEAVQALVEAIGKSDAWVYQYLQLPDLCSELQDRMHPDIEDDKRLRFGEAVVLAPLPAATQRKIYRALLKYPPGARTLQAKRLAAAETGTPVQRRTSDIRGSTTRFVVRVRAEIDRVLDYKQADFRAALAVVPPLDRRAFRVSVAMLLQAIDDAQVLEGAANDESSVSAPCRAPARGPSVRL